jgi:peptidoglycan/LPS O-acetylase OafA/YrhL
MTNANNRLLYLDSIRGIAALTVVFSHFVERTPLYSFEVFKYFTPGQFGVVIFFLLSGFVIPFSFKDGPGAIKSFVTSRIFRLYPAYWLSVALACISITFVLKIEIDAATIIANLTMLQTALRKPDLFGVYWTLFTELIFYGMCATLYALGALRRLDVRFTASAIFLLCGLIGAFLRKYYALSLPVGILISLSLMFFGSVWREVALENSMRAKKMTGIWLATFTAAFTVIALLVYDFDRGHGESAASYIGSYITGIAFFIVMTTKIQLTNKVLVWLGAISYSAYLLHPFFLELASKHFKIEQSFDISTLLVYLACTIALASFSYLAIEKPSQKLGKVLFKAEPTTVPSRFKERAAGENY